MNKEKNYYCEHPVVLIMFNRPAQTARILNSIRRVKPGKLFIISDGPRQGNPFDLDLVRECRALINQVDWPCTIETNFSDVNLGCRRRVNTGLDWVFSLTDAAIILEDDCLPTVEFFKFLDWGLLEFKDDEKIGMISGSNLIDYLHKSHFRNGFSSLINIWGWGTWKHVWKTHNTGLSLGEIKKVRNKLRNTKMKFWQELYWNEIFKNVVITGSTWDFQLQHTFFRMDFYSVYPSKNLIYNIGFDAQATHTSSVAPEYVEKSKPVKGLDILSNLPTASLLVDTERDINLMKTIWSYSPLTALRLYITNLYRYLTI